MKVIFYRFKESACRWLTFIDQQPDFDNERKKSSIDYLCLMMNRFNCAPAGVGVILEAGVPFKSFSGAAGY